MVERGVGPKSLKERSKGALRARLLLSYVLCGAWCVELIHPLSGVPCPPFYRPRGSKDYRWEKEEKLEVEKVLRRCRVFLFP